MMQTTRSSSNRIIFQGKKAPKKYLMSCFSFDDSCDNNGKRYFTSSMSYEFVQARRRNVKQPHQQQQINQLWSSTLLPYSNSIDIFFGNDHHRRYYHKSRRSRRLHRLDKKAAGESIQKNEDDDFEEEDTRTWRGILFGHINDDPAFKKFEVQKEYDDVSLRVAFQNLTYAQWKQALSLAWADYKVTWDYSADWAQKKKKNEEAKENDDKDEDKLNISKKADEVRDNLKKNIDSIKPDAEKFVDAVKEKTGIYTKEDLKKLAKEALILASECVSQFTQGYRKGRDEEVEKMLTEYFQDLVEDSDDKEDEQSDGKKKNTGRLHVNKLGGGRRAKRRINI